MTNRDRADLADLAMRALDTIIEDYGEDARLCAASLVFEVKVGEGDDAVYHVNYKSRHDDSPSHIAGLLHGVAGYLTSPDEE